MHGMITRAMKSAVAVVAVTLAVAGCNKPASVEFRLDDENSALEVSRVVADSEGTWSPVDSSALLPDDPGRFAGQLQIGRITVDHGQAGRGSFAFTRVLFENRQDVVLGPSGRILGYHGIDLGPMTLNGVVVFRIPHRIRGRLGRPDTIAGTEYYRELSAMVQPVTRYTWSTLLDSIGPIGLSITTPDDMEVDAPKGGAVIRRDRDLVLQWRGEGKILIVISVETLSGTKPLLLVRVRENKRRAILPSRGVLQALPRGSYVFTFVRANRRETERITGFSGPVLVQAASVYNSYVELQ